jgi:hypothetical protein
MFKLLLAVLVAVGFSGPLRAAPAKKVLFLAGKRSHGPGQHEHRAGCLLLAKGLNESGLKVSAKVISVWPQDLSDFDGVDAVVIYADAGGKYKDDQYAILDKKVKAGMGIMFIHYGVHPRKNIGQQYFIPWIGGYFESRWSVNPHWTAELTPKKGHPVSYGIEKPVLANDEFYYNMRFPGKDDCADCYPLVQSPLRTERLTKYNNLWNEHGDAIFGKNATLMWCRDSKTQGRGAGFSGGHFHRNWAIDGFRQMTLNAIVWIARGDVPKDGVKSKPISDELLNENLDSKPRTPLTKPTKESILAMEPMLRPKDPAKYNQRAHYALIKKLKAEAKKK